MVTPIEGDIPACVAWELTGPESGQSLEDANWITKVSNIMELIFWSQYSLPDKTKIGTQWGIDTEAPHLRSSSLTQACPPGDLWGCVFDELVCEKTSASSIFFREKWKRLEIDKSVVLCWAHQPKERPESSLLTTPLPLPTLPKPPPSLGVVGSAAFPSARTPQIFQGQAQGCAPGPPALATSPFHLAYGQKHRAPSSSFTYSWALTSMESTRRWRLFWP